LFVSTVIFVSLKSNRSQLICSYIRAAVWTACRSSIRWEVRGVNGDGWIQFDVDAAQQ